MSMSSICQDNRYQNMVFIPSLWHYENHTERTHTHTHSLAHNLLRGGIQIMQQLEFASFKNLTGTKAYCNYDVQSKHSCLSHFYNILPLRMFLSFFVVALTILQKCHNKIINTKITYLHMNICVTPSLSLSLWSTFSLQPRINIEQHLSHFIVDNVYVRLCVHVKS